MEGVATPHRDRHPHRSGTKTYARSGGIMLPNHAPYIIAEQFGTLERLFPGRIDLGLGRAPGTDQIAVQAMRRSPEASEQFPQDVLELQAFLAPASPGQRIVAVPAAGTNVPLWILGSSLRRVAGSRTRLPTSPRTSRRNAAAGVASPQRLKPSGSSIGLM